MIRRTPRTVPTTRFIPPGYIYVQEKQCDLTDIHSSPESRSSAATGPPSASTPPRNEQLEPAYTLITEEQLKAATAAAAEAYASFSSLDPDTHAAFLDAIADNIEAIGDELIIRAGQETGLPAARLQGERARTTGQLRLFASVVRQGDFRGVRIDPALPERTPLPRADIRQRQIPLGPVAVFGASNFPLAFSTAGGDTASALAAGCPVVFKAHNAHPGTGELVGQAVVKAVKDLGLHPGVFSLIYGPGASIGQALVADPAIKAVGFTGSQAAGIALMRTAAARPEPIPVYAEMSSLNPVFVFPGALNGSAEHIDALARQYVTAVTGSSGQLCTSPGLLFAPAGEAGDKLAAAVGRAVSACAGQTMLTEGIAGSWNAGADALGSADNVTVIGQGTPGPTENAPAPTIFGTDIADFVSNHVLHEEIFGAAVPGDPLQLHGRTHRGHQPARRPAHRLPAAHRRGLPDGGPADPRPRAEGGTDHRQRLAHRRRSRPRHGPRRPLPRNLRHQDHLRGNTGNQPLPAARRLPEPAPGTACRITAG